jgi:crotonobetainyl-CoA:carnitine CoA-transferase CaiB-like acyl-CoA transferase
MLGEHTEAVLGELCGVTEEEVKRLREVGVV